MTSPAPGIQKWRSLLDGTVCRDTSNVGDHPTLDELTVDLALGQPPLSTAASTD